MNYIDIIIGILLLLAAINGFRKGLMSELASLAALVLGIWGAIEFSYITSDFLVENFHLESKHLNLISFIITFIIIVILIQIIGNSLSTFMEVAMLGFINKMAGLLFGIIRSALIISILLMVIEHFESKITIITEEAQSKSQLYEPIRNFAPSLLPFVKKWESEEELKEGAKDVVKKIKETIQT